MPAGNSTIIVRHRSGATSAFELAKDDETGGEPLTGLAGAELDWVLVDEALDHTAKAELRHHRRQFYPRSRR